MSDRTGPDGDRDGREEVERLRARLHEAEETLAAIRRGEVDALVVEGPDGPRVYTLTSADETYRLLVERMREGAVTVSADGVVLYCNRRFAEMLRLPAARVIGRPVLPHVAEADRAAFAALLLGGEGSGEEGRELELRAADGTRVPAYVSAGALTIGGLPVRGLVVTDLTQQETRARLASIVESSDDAVVGETLDRVITSWNAGAEKLLGYTAAEMIGRHASALAPPERAGEVEEVLRRLMRENRAQRLETKRVRRDGVRIDVALTVSPTRDAHGRITGLSVIARDITERRRAEEALRAAHARTIEILESISDGFVAIDRGWRYTYVNAAAARLLRRTPEELLGRVVWEVFPEAKASPAYGELSRAMERRAAVRFEVYAPGFDTWFENRAYPSRDGISVFFADVTERKRAEEQQRLLAAELDHRVKNTLASVQSLVAHSRREGDTVERFGERLEGRIGAKARAHNLLTQSRWKGADLRELVAQELAPYREPDAGGISVEGPQIVLRPAAALSLSLVVHELATNAAKYGALSAPAGRVGVSWRIEEPGGEAGPWLALDWVEGGGPDVAPPAARGFGSTVIERGVAYELEGEARLEFRPEGLRCLLRAPLATIGRVRAAGDAAAGHGVPAAAAPSGGDGAGRGAGGGRRILVVEDEMLVALDVGAALTAIGFAVVGPVGRLDEALALARAEPLAGAVLDVNLAGERVFPVADELVRRGVPLIFSTGYDGASIMPPAYRDRPRLEKPFAGDDLRRLAAIVFR